MSKKRNDKPAVSRLPATAEDIDIPRLKNLDMTGDVKPPKHIKEFQARRFAEKGGLGEIERLDPKKAAEYWESIEDQKAKFHKYLLAYSTYRDSPEGLAHLKNLIPDAFEAEVNRYEKDFTRDTKLHELLVKGTLDTPEELDFIYNEICNPNTVISPFPGFDPYGKFMGQEFWTKFYTNRSGPKMPKTYGLFTRHFILPNPSGKQLNDTTALPGTTEQQLQLKRLIVEHVVNKDSPAYQKLLETILNPMNQRESATDPIFINTDGSRRENPYTYMGDPTYPFE